jgi:hypothetical protein
VKDAKANFRKGSTSVIESRKPNYRFGSISTARLRHERQSIIDHLGLLANSKSTFFTKHVHRTSLGEPFALQQTQSNLDNPFFERQALQSHAWRRRRARRRGKLCFGSERGTGR